MKSYIWQFFFRTSRTSLGCQRETPAPFQPMNYYNFDNNAEDLWGLLGFVRQRSHLTRSSPLASATDDAEPRVPPHFHLRSTQGAGQTCRPPAPRSSSHEAVAAFNIPTFHYHPRNPSESQTVHSEVEVMINKASRNIIESISSYLCIVARTGVRIG